MDWNGEEVSRPPYREMYWSPAQMLAHMTVNGASARTGDLFASGTISGPDKRQRGAFIELTWGGREPITVKGEERTFLEDGDDGHDLRHRPRRERRPDRVRRGRWHDQASSRLVGWVTGGVDAGMTAGRPMPTQDDVLGYFDTLSNWGRWGDDDELGTLNHITDDVRLAAARAVRHGRSVSCAWEIAVPEEMERSTTTCPCAADMPGAENMPVPAFHDDRRWGFSNERLGIMFHGNTVTHVDSPCHIFWDGTMYNGRSHSLVDPATGSAWAAVTAAANGIITRGVLLDIARVRDVPWLEPGQGVFPDDLEEAERRQGVRVRPGDAVLLRTGYGRVRHEAGVARGVTQAGWHASCLPWLHEREVALIGADTPQDVQPSGYEDVLMPVHAVSLVAMGLWMLDNCDLEVCATTAAELGQWDFHLAVAPVRFAGTSGSPVNPIATF